RHLSFLLFSPLLREVHRDGNAGALSITSCAVDCARPGLPLGIPWATGGCCPVEMRRAAILRVRRRPGFLPLRVPGLLLFLPAGFSAAPLRPARHRRPRPAGACPAGCVL